MFPHSAVDCLLVLPKESLDKIEILENLQNPSDINPLIHLKHKHRYSIVTSENDDTRIHVKAVKKYYGKQYDPEKWIVDLIYLNYDKISLLHPEKVIFTFVLAGRVQGNSQFDPEIVRKIAEMNAVLRMTFSKSKKASYHYK
jgi:hypothetical protein